MSDHDLSGPSAAKREIAALRAPLGHSKPGPKRGPPSRVIRVPEAIVDRVKKMVEEYLSRDQSGYHI